MKSVIIRAHAKINLTLDVLERRKDGYHNIESIFHTISFADRITIKLTNEIINLTCDEPTVPLGDENLIIKAAKIYFKKINSKLGAAIHLTKRIPMQAGLGGGSSDAASTLLALNLLFDSKLPLDQLVELGSDIGSDVPFFLYSGAAFVSGKGEMIEPINALYPIPMVIIKPKESMCTKNAYILLDQAKISHTKSTHKLRIVWDSDIKSEILLSHIHNDFEAPIIKKIHSITKASELLQELGAMKTVLCGSGSAVAGFFHTPHAARLAALSAKNRGFWSCFTHTVGKEYTQNYKISDGG